MVDVHWSANTKNISSDSCPPQKVNPAWRTRMESGEIVDSTESADGNRGNRKRVSGRGLIGVSRHQEGAENKGARGAWRPEPAVILCVLGNDPKLRRSFGAGSRGGVRRARAWPRRGCCRAIDAGDREAQRVRFPADRESLGRATCAGARGCRTPSNDSRFAGDGFPSAG